MSVRTIAQRLRIKADLALDLTAQGVTDEAKRLAAVGKYTDGRAGGRLRGSISWARANDVGGYEKIGTDSTSDDALQKSPNKETIWIGTNVEYAAHVEFGTGGRGGVTKKSGFGSIQERSEKIGSGKGGQVAQPFLRPAAKQANRILKEVLAAMK